MKISFNDGGYIEIIKSINNKVIISISAKDKNDPLKRICNSIEITEKQLNEMLFVELNKVIS